MESLCRKEPITNEMHVIMPQGILRFKYEEEKRSGRMTGLAGLPTYLDHAYVLGLGGSIGEHVKVRDGGQGFTDPEKLS